MEEKYYSIKCPACQTTCEVMVPRFFSQCQMASAARTDRSTCPKCNQVLSIKWRRERDKVIAERVRVFDKETLEVAHEGSRA